MVVVINASHYQLHLIVIFNDPILATRTYFHAVLIPIRIPQRKLFRFLIFNVIVLLILIISIYAKCVTVEEG